MHSKTLIVIDGYSLLFRAFYSTRFLSTSDGRPTNALYGFVSMLFALIDKYDPQCILVALDAHAPTFRHEEYEAYKGTRQETPQELISQLIESRELIAALSIPTLELNGFEADDIVGTISKQAESQGYHTLIVTGDLDSLQLVDDHVHVVTPKQGVTEVMIYDIDAVVARYGFGPEFVPDYKALVGDTSDNIPGVPGIGDKSATKLITQFGPVEEIMAKLPQVEEKFRKKLEPALEQIPKSKRLATIVRDVPVNFSFETYKLNEAQQEAAQQFLLELEFKSHSRRVPQILGRYLNGGNENKTAPKVTVAEERLEPVLVGELATINALKSFVGDHKAAIHWTQAPAANLLDEGSGGAAFVSSKGKVAQVSADLATAFFQEDPDRCLVHDAKPHCVQSDLRPPAFDTMLAGFVLQPGRGQYGLRELAVHYLDVMAPEQPEQIALAISFLSTELHDRIVKEEQQKIYYEIELPLIPVLREMEGLGVRVSRAFLEDFSKTLQVEIAQVEEEVYRLADHKFLIGSPKQLGETLFEKLNLPNGKKTKTGWSTGAEVLQDYVADFPVVAAVLRWRELTKLKSTYADALPRMIGPDGRIHTTLNQIGAATGRLSSVEPNLQNIPIRTELGRQIRKAFIAEEGFRLLSLDYSQIELRLLASLCKDEKLVDAFVRREDVHTVTASLMFSTAEDSVSKEQRRLAKMLNYAVLYGVTDFGLAQQLGEGFSVSDSKALINQYFERFPKIKQFTNGIIEETRQKGFTRTLMGRRRYFPDIHASNRTERNAAERAAINAPIQGAAADLVKMAMLDVRKLLGAQSTRMLLQVHDELVFEMPPKDEGMVESVRHAMEQAMPIDVPIEVDAKIGLNWNEMAKI